MSAATTGFKEPGLWSSVWKLLRLRLVILISGFRRAKLRTKIAYIFFWLVVLSLMGFVVFISFTILSFMRSPALAGLVSDVDAFFESFPTLLVSVSGAGILLTGFGVLLQALYLAGDMDFLMTAPVPVRAVFIAKLVQAVLPNFGIMALFSLPVLFGLGLSSGYHWLYYPLVVAVLAVVSLAAASLASLLVMTAARFFPARRMAEVLGFVVGTFFMIWSQSARFMNFDVNEQQVSSLLRLTGRFDAAWSPLAWAGRGLVRVGQSEWLAGIGLLAAALAVAGGVFYAALVASEKLYHSGWSQLQNTRRRVRKPRQLRVAPVIDTAAGSAAGGPAAIRTSRLQTLGNVMPAVSKVRPAGPVRAIFTKDLLLYRRDLRQMSQLLTPLILGVVYAVSMLQPGGMDFEGQGSAPDWFMDSLKWLFSYADVGLALFLGWMLVANMAGLGFTHEGRSYWMLKAAPISSRQLLTAKFMVGYVPALVICEVYVVALEVVKGAPVWSLLVSMLSVALALAGVAAVYLAFGTRGAKFDWETPQQANRGIGCLGSLVGFLFVGVCFLLLLGPVLAVTLLGLPTALGQAVGLLLCAAGCAAALLIAYKTVEPHVPMLSE